MDKILKLKVSIPHRYDQNPKKPHKKGISLYRASKSRYHDHNHHITKNFMVAAISRTDILSSTPGFFARPEVDDKLVCTSKSIPAT